MLKGTYNGPTVALQGKSALLKDHRSNPDLVEAQFDDLSLGLSLTHAWTIHRREYWKINPPVDWED